MSCKLANLGRNGIGKHSQGQTWCKGSEQTAHGLPRRASTIASPAKNSCVLRAGNSAINNVH